MQRPPGRPSSHNRTISRDDLLSLATADFAEKGFAGVSIRKLAAQAGVSDSLFIHHFGSKLELWREAVDRLIEREFHQLIARPNRHDHETDPLALLQDDFSQFLHLAQQRPAIFRLLFNELDSGGERAEYLKTKYLIPYVKMFDQTIEQCQARRLIKPVSRNALHALLLGAVNILIRPEILVRPEILRQGLPADVPQPAAPATHATPAIPVADLLEMIFSGVTNPASATSAQNGER